MKTNEIDAAAEIGADMLRGVRGFLERGWTQEANARDAEGYSVGSGRPEAVCWCLRGAALAATKKSDWLASALGFFSVAEMVDWNDALSREKTEVLARIDQALERAGGGE